MSTDDPLIRPWPPEPPPEDDTARRVKAARAYSGMTLGEFAKAVEIGRNTLLRIEQGKRNPKPGELRQMAHVAELPYDFFTLPMWLIQMLGQADFTYFQRRGTRGGIFGPSVRPHEHPTKDVERQLREAQLEAIETAFDELGRVYEELLADLDPDARAEAVRRMPAELRLARLKRGIGSYRTVEVEDDDEVRADVRQFVPLLLDAVALLPEEVRAVLSVGKDEPESDEALAARLGVTLEEIDKRRARAREHVASTFRELSGGSLNPVQQRWVDAVVDVLAEEASTRSEGAADVPDRLPPATGHQRGETGARRSPRRRRSSG